MRAMTITGLCVFLDITFPTWADYKGKPDFSYIVEKVEKIIWVYKFEGAVVGLLNPNIIARELGLAERQRVTSSRLPDASINR